MIGRGTSLSDCIKITVVTDVEKSNISNNKLNTDTEILTHDISMTLMSTLQNNGIIQEGFCGGKGICGRCKVRFLTGAPIPKPVERRVFSAKELRDGYRLSCVSMPREDCTIRIAFSGDENMEIVTDMIGLSKENDLYSQEIKQTENRIAGAMIAVDLGTTTIAMQLRLTDSGEILDTYCEVNPQRIYGYDVLSRMRASVEGYGKELGDLVWNALERGIHQFQDVLLQINERNALEDNPRITIQCMSIAGNTTMGHLLMNYDVSKMAVSPFLPVDIGLQKMNTHHNLDFPVYLVPGISTFVGGDIVAGLCATGLLNPRDRGSSLLIDLGTNGEIALVDGDTMLVTATAAGPAFEGGSTQVVVGADMIKITAALLREGIIDDTGLMREPYFEEGVTVCFDDQQQECSNMRFVVGKADEKALYICQKDIRAIQLAKAAVFAGIEILMEKRKSKDIDRVYLAGGFGYYLDVEDAFAIGLLPKELKGRVHTVGNTSLEGAFRIGRVLCREGEEPVLAMQDYLHRAQCLNLAMEPSFEKRYLDAMNFVTQ